MCPIGRRLMIEFSEGWDRLDGCLHGAPGKYDALHAQVSRHPCWCWWWYLTQYKHYFQNEEFYV